MINEVLAKSTPMEAVEYKGIGTDVVDKKKKLNPQPNFTTTKKTVKDFKEEVELIDEISKQTADSYLSKVTKDQVGKHGMQPNMFDKLPKNRQHGVSNALKRLIKPERPSRPGDIHGKSFTEEIELDESSLHRQHFQLVADLISGHESAEKRKELAHHHAELFKKANPSFDHAKFMKAAGVNESIEEAKVYDPFTKKMVATKPIKVQAGGGATRNGVPVETGPSKYKSKLPMSKAAGVLAAEEVELIDELDKKTIGSYAKKATKDLKWQQTMRPFDAKRISNREKGIDKAIDRLAKEDVEQIDELSKRTLALYAKKATSSMKMKQMAATHLRDKHRDASDKHQSGVFNRETGIKRAIDKLAGKYYHEDVEQIDELSKDTLASYAKKASQDARIKQHVAADFKSKEAHARNPRKKETWGSIAKKYQSKAWKREDGHDKAIDKLAKEETEQIDEVSKSTLMRYIPKASRDVADNVYSAKDQINRSTEHTRAGDWDASKTAHTKATTLFNKANKRIAGIDTATKKLGTQKEEVQVDEAIAKKLPVQHAVDAVHATLGPRSATRFLSHLSPGSDKHTTWDKVNDALVKQGVQTRHIASIAQKTSHANVNESRGHKVLATFFKNREVAQRAYQGNPAKDAEVAQGGGSPADQGIAAAKKDAADLKKKLSEDQYTSEYKIKSFVDPVTGENKTRKIRPHRINFKSSKMNAAPAQMTEPTKVTEGHDDYSSIAKELIKKHGKNVTAQHVKDFAGERDTHRGLDHAEVMHHVKKLSEDDKIYDEKWKKVKFTDFIKGAK